MLAGTPSGDAYTLRDLTGMLKAAGFADVSAHPLHGPETLVVGSYYPSGTFRRFSDQIRREMEAAAGSDLGKAYSLAVAFSSTPSPAPGYDVVEVIITRTRR